MNEIRVNNKVYFTANDIVGNHPEMFKEGKKKPRNLVEYKHIPQDQYIFGSCVKTGWRVSNESNNKAKLLITKEWLDQYLASPPPPPTETPVVRPIVSDIKDAPPILELTDAEKFKDHNGKVLEIEVRGERSDDGCFFRVKDVAVCFNDIHLTKNIDRADITHTSYRIQEDFLYFYRLSDRESTDNAIQQKKKELFFTYQGMLRYLFVSWNPNARAFRKWATRVLFAMQMGTVEQKESVAAELLGISPETVSKFLSACVRDIPMVYMLHLGNVPDSVDVEGDRDDFLFFKIGQHGKEKTKYGFKGRCKGHQQEFKEFRPQMSYLHFVFLDPMYVSESEKSIKDFFSPYRVNYQDKSEVYVIPKSKLEEIKTFFHHLSVIYSGNHTDIQRSWDEFRNDTRTRIHDLEVENQHLKDMMDQKESHYQTLIETLTTKTQMIIDNLQDRVTEQAATIRTFISRLIG